MHARAFIGARTVRMTAAAAAASVGICGTAHRNERGTHVHFVPGIL